MDRAILIIEDEATLARNVAAYLARHGYEAHTAASAEDGLAQLDTLRPDIVLLDHNLPGLSGLEALGRIRRAAPDAQVVMVTGHGSTELAVEAMKAGAADFLNKPVALGELKLVLERVGRQRQLASTVDYYRRREAEGSGLDAIVGESPPMRALKQTITRLLAAERDLVDASPPAVLIVGETGTGKELVARALHFGGARATRPFVEINCGALPANLIESELFGYERGAFTDARERKAGLLETADGGSVFLDEIGEAEPGTQVKLLKLLEEKRVRRLGGVRELPIDTRILSATNQPLEQRVREGRFRADLYYRLRIVEILIPPLRERGDDILLLARQFLATHGARYRKPLLTLGPDAERALAAHAWPGNVRELRNTIEQAVLAAEAPTVHAADLRLGAVAMERASAEQDLNLERAERRLIAEAMARTQDNVTAAARLLGISRDTLRYRLERLAQRDGAAEGG
ncbi:MAG TPA: sigma-54 dependent transcriptional regulator [Methylibium sp.]|nr:sigma-54 dependent transcriptional regulator [Methylibium sp.]